MTRRTVLTMAAFAGAGGVAASYRMMWPWGAGSVDAAPIGEAAATPKIVTIVDYSDQGVRGEARQVPKVVKSEAEWRRALSSISFEVTRHEGTERAFTGSTWNLHDKGIYRCVCCDTAVFNADTKFESGTGWPSFWKPIDKQNVVERRDVTLGMERTAVECRRCDAHLGHVFDDGPKPTGLRYCMNSAAMKFAKA